MSESTDNRADEPDTDDLPEGSGDSQSHDDAATEPTVEIPAHEAELTKLREERDQLEQKLQRAMADTQNIRRRQRQEMDDSRRRVLEGLTQELLPVLDSFALALQAYDGGNTNPADESANNKTGDTAALVEGVRMVQTLLSGALERHGLQQIPTDGPFDPARHEALGVEPSTDVPDNHIVRVVQTGYMLGEHVVRHSKVIVAGPNHGAEDA